MAKRGLPTPWFSAAPSNASIHSRNKQEGLRFSFVYSPVDLPRLRQDSEHGFHSSSPWSCPVAAGMCFSPCPAQSYDFSCAVTCHRDVDSSAKGSFNSVDYFSSVSFKKVVGGKCAHPLSLQKSNALQERDGGDHGATRCLKESVRSGSLSSPNMKQADGSSRGCLLALQLCLKRSAAESRGWGAGGHCSGLESAI